jgi:hypothetical protein
MPFTEEREVAEDCHYPVHGNTVRWTGETAKGKGLDGTGTMVVQ